MNRLQWDRWLGLWRFWAGGR